MKRNTSCKFVELLHPPCNTPGWQFFELLSQPSPQKQVNMRTNELQNHHVLDLTSHPALDPCPVKLGREPKWRHFDVLWRGVKIRGFNQSKFFLRHITPRNKPYYFSGKNFGDRCTLKQWWTELVGVERIQYQHYQSLACILFRLCSVPTRNPAEGREREGMIEGGRVELLCAWLTKAFRSKFKLANGPFRRYGSHFIPFQPYFPSFWKSHCIASVPVFNK